MHAQSTPAQTITALAETLGRAERFSVKAELKRAHEALPAGETPQLMAVGAHEGSGNSLIVLTEQYLLIINETGGLHKAFNVAVIFLSHVVSVSSQSGRSGTLTVETSSSRTNIHRIMPGERAGEMAERIRAYIAQSTPAASAPATGPAERLASAKAMLDSGAISPGEYDDIRKRVLAEM